jgi:hypothetical protein
MSKKIEKFASKNPATFGALFALIGQASVIVLTIAIMR